MNILIPIYNINSLLLDLLETFKFIIKFHHITFFDIILKNSYK